MDNDSFSHDQDILDILNGLESNKAEYPPELLAARRKLFIEQLEKRAQPEAVNALTESDWKLINIFRRLKALDPDYPPQRLAHTRSLYKEQVLEALQNTVWYVLRSNFRRLFAGWTTSYRSLPMLFARAATLAVSAAMIAFVANALYGKTIPSNSFLPSQTRLSTPTPVLRTPVAQAVVICEDGYEPTVCLTNKLGGSQHVSEVGNGKARPAVAKDTFGGSYQAHEAAHVNDGLYGPGASWVSNSPNSWIKIDLGITANVNTVAFGRDRQGNLNDGDPGRFVIAVATSDDVYANGNSSNDELEYVQVYDSEKAGFDGTISGAETVVALFEMKQARFIKITFENARTAVDEVEAFVSDPSKLVIPTKERPQKESPTGVASTPLPAESDTAVPIDTLPPTDMSTAVPTDPPVLEQTPVPPSHTPVPFEPTIPPPIDTVVPTLTEPPPIVPGYTPISVPTDEPSVDHGPPFPLPDPGDHPGRGDPPRRNP